MGFGKNDGCGCGDGGFFNKGFFDGGCEWIWIVIIIIVILCCCCG